MPVPGFVLDLKFGHEFGQVLRGGQRVMPRRALDLGYEFKHPELDEALTTCSRQAVARVAFLGLRYSKGALKLACRTTDCRPRES